MSNYTLSKLYFTAISFYILSLITPAFSTLDNQQTSYGLMVLMTGWSQTIFYLFIAVSSFSLSALINALPWLGNFFIIGSFFTLRNCRSERQCCYFAWGGVICTSVFLANPVANIGQDIQSVSLSFGIGTLFWCSSAWLVLYLFYMLRKQGVFKQKTNL